MNKVLTIGTFDLFHRGHRRFLSMCARLGEVTAAVNTDEFVAAYKGRLPVEPFGTRMRAVAACTHVRRAIPHASGADAKPTVESVGPDVLAIGTDWASKDYYAQLQLDQGWLDARGIVLCYLPYTLGISTTLLRTARETE